MYFNIDLTNGSQSTLLTLGGAELSDSRRCVDFTEFERMRIQYKASATVDIRIDVSFDWGDTWYILLSSDNYNTNPTVTTWVPIPSVVSANECLIRAVGIGSGLLTTISFVQMELS